MRKVSIITIPLVFYHSRFYWGLFEKHTGKVREHLLNHPTGGKQISFAFNKAVESGDDILILVDDKFGFEKNQNRIVPESDLEDFLKTNPLPDSWVKKLIKIHVIKPEKDFSLTKFSFSEKKLLEKSDGSLPGECANEWLTLLEYLNKQGYEKINAYVPSLCAKGICYATPYAMENGVWEKPITLSFTYKDTISSEYVL